MRKQHHSPSPPPNVAKPLPCCTAAPRGLDSSACPHSAGGRWACGAASAPMRQVAALCGVSARTVARVRERFATRRVCRGAARAAPSRIGPQALRRAGSAPHALACTAPPPGAPAGACGCWPSASSSWRRCRPISRELVRTTLKKTVSSPGGQRWVIPPARQRRLRGGHGGRAWPSMPVPSIRARPLVCFDEAGKDLKAHTRPPQPAAPGRRARGQRVRPRRQPQSVSGLCPAPRLAPHRRHRAPHRPSTSRTPCARWSTSHFPHAERIVLVTDQPQHPHARPRSITPSHRPRPGASWRAWSGTTPPPMAVG